jgi:nucleoside-diphosphate-sugar epimerase
MQVLVLGGTRFFGATIVRQLVAAGHTVTVFSRRSSAPAPPEATDGPRVSFAVPPGPGALEYLHGDRTRPDDLRAALGGRSFDAVIDNIAYDGDQVTALLDVLQGRVGRYVLTSTTELYEFSRHRSPRPLEEDVSFDWDPPELDLGERAWRYRAGKRRAEHVVRHRPGLSFTVIRPAIVAGPGDPTGRAWFYLQRLLDGGPLLLLDGGTAPFRLAYSDDLAAAYVAAIESLRAARRIYTVAQPEVLTVRRFVELAAAALGRVPDLVPVPRRAVEATGLLHDDPYGRAASFVPEVGRAAEDLALRATPVAEWIARTARWYRDAYRGPDSAGYVARDAERALAAWTAERAARSRAAAGSPASLPPA